MLKLLPVRPAKSMRAALVSDCRRGDLASFQTDNKIEVMVIGEGPGADEDAQRPPLSVGRTAFG